MTLIYILSITVWREKGVNRQWFAMSTSRVPVPTYQLQCYDKLASKFILRPLVTSGLRFIVTGFIIGGYPL